MRRGDRAASLLRVATLALGLLLPSLTLIPLGSLWLWERGYLLYWALFAAILVLGSYAWQRWLLRNPRATTPADAGDADDTIASAGAATPGEPAEGPDPAWTRSERQAWADVVAIARATNPEKLTSREDLLNTAVHTIETVARRLHPEVAEPVWQFTVPEAMAIIERVSRRLGAFFVEHVPLSDRLTVARVLTFYRWRGAVDVAERAYDVWRIIRFANPLAAATNEVREQLSRQMLQWGRDHVARQLAQAYILEIGRAAIDLYGGRLRIADEALETHVTAASRRDLEAMEQSMGEPLRVLVAGRAGAGRSSLVRALAGEVHATVERAPGAKGTYRVRKPGFPPAIAIDSPALGETDADMNALIAHAMDADLIIWVVSAVAHGDRTLERRAMAALNGAFTSQQRRNPPAQLVALTHIDRLPPAQAWAPPYDLNAPRDEKAQRIARTVDDVAQRFGMPGIDVVPLRVDTLPAYNVDALWSRVTARLPQAESARLARRLVDAQRGWNLRQIGSQAVNAGRILTRSFRRR
jgi:uncharacterized protein